MTGAIFISDDLVQGLNLLKPIQAFSRVMSLSFGMISICICTITSSNIQTNEICLLCISSITLCNPCICTIASFHLVLLQVLYLYYWKFCSCPIANSVFVLLKFYLLVLLQIWYLYNCKFCICTIVSSLARSTIASFVFVLLQVLYLYYWKYKILDLNPWRRASASPLIQLFTKSLGTPRRFSIVTFLCMYCIEVSKLLNLSKQKY